VSLLRRAIKDALETQKKDVQKWFKEIKNKLKTANISVVDKIIISASSIVGEIVGFADNEKIDNNFGNERKNWF